MRKRHFNFGGKFEFGSYLSYYNCSNNFRHFLFWTECREFSIFLVFFFAFFDTYVTNWKQQKSLLNLLLPKSYLSEEKRISSTSQRGKVVSKALEKILSSALFVSWMIFVWSFPWVYMRFLFSYSKIQQ